MNHLSPSELNEAPELAIPQALEVTIDIAGAALFAANPELQIDCFLETVEPTVQVCLADAILLHLDGLRCALQRYHHYADNADARASFFPLRPTQNPHF